MRDGLWIARRWHWFIEQLTAVIVEQAGLRPRRRYVVVQNGDRFRLLQCRRGGKIDRVVEGSLEAIGRRLPRGRDREEVELRLDDKSLLSRIVHLPAATHAHLASAVSLQLERMTPWAQGRAVHAYGVRRDPELVRAGQIAVQVIAMASAELSKWAERLRAAGLMAAAIGSATEDPARPLRVELLGRAEMFRRRVRRGVTGAVALVLFGGAVSVGWSAYSLQAEKTLLAHTTDRLEVVRAQIAALKTGRASADASDRLLERKVTQVPLVVLLDAISAALPDSTYLIELAAEDGEVRLSGLSDDANSLILVLEETDLLQGVRFASAIVSDDDAHGERFDIVAAVTETEEQP